MGPSIDDRERERHEEEERPADDDDPVHAPASRPCPGDPAAIRIIPAAASTRQSQPSVSSVAIAPASSASVPDLASKGSCEAAMPVPAAPTPSPAVTSDAPRSATPLDPRLARAAA